MEKGSKARKAGKEEDRGQRAEGKDPPGLPYHGYTGARKTEGSWGM